MPPSVNRSGDLTPEDEQFIGKLMKQLRKLTDFNGMLKLDDEFLDELVGTNDKIKKLEQERRELHQQVSNLASFNYAREPEFVRDRLALRQKLDEVIPLRKRVSARHLEPLIHRLNGAKEKLCKEAIKVEEESENIAQELLDGRLDYDQFLEKYIQARKETSKKRILADKLAKERDRLAETLLMKPAEQYSPVPKPRQRRRSSMNK